MTRSIIPLLAFASATTLRQVDAGVAASTGSVNQCARSGTTTGAYITPTFPGHAVADDAANF